MNIQIYCSSGYKHKLGHFIYSANKPHLLLCVREQMILVLHVNFKGKIFQIETGSFISPP